MPKSLPKNGIQKAIEGLQRISKHRARTELLLISNQNRADPKRKLKIHALLGFSPSISPITNS